MLKPGDASAKAALVPCLLFLDVDGVLNTSTMAGGARVHPKLMKRLASIVQATDCGIILSSTWRFDDERYYYNVLVDELGKVGVNDESVVGFTPTVQPVRRLRQDGTYGAIEGAVELQRCQEILAWLDEHATQEQRWAVLDDLNLTASIHNDTTVTERMQGHVVKTDCEAGLTEKKVQEVVQILVGTVQKSGNV